jgi:dipeptidyl aminopeptidase/acylaminoacyl peptidase
MKPSLSLDDLYTMKKLREAKLVPGSSDVVCIISTSIDDRDHFSIIKLNTETLEQTVVAEVPDVCSGLRVAPDGRRLSYLGKISEQLQIMVVEPVEGAIPQPLMERQRGISTAPIWSPDGNWLAFTAIGEERFAKGPYHPVRSGSVHYKFDGGIGLVERNAQDVFVVSANGKDLKRLTFGPHLMTNLSWAPDSRSIAFSATLDPEDVEFVTRVGKVDLEGNITWPVEGIEDYLFAGPAISGDGRAILLPSKPPSLPLGGQARLYRVPIDGKGKFEPRTEQLARERGGHVSRGALLPLGLGSLFAKQPISPSGSDVAFCVIELKGQSVVHRIALSGEERCEAVTPIDQSAYLQDATEADVLFAKTDMNAPPDLWIARADGSNPKQLTHLNDAFLEDRSLPEIVEIHTKAEDGTPLHGWFYKPLNSEGAVPTVLEIHGGPHAAWGNAFNLWAHALAGAGIGVLLPNPRGSSGYGDEFGTAIHGCWGDPDGADLLRMVDQVIDMGLADPDRLGIGGVSGGGHLSTWLIGHTDRFKAAIPEQMLTNMVSFYGESDIGRLLIKGEFGVTPQTDHELLWRYSPLAYAKNVRTPTLLIQCENDVRCPMGEAEQFFRALKDAGCEAEFMRIPKSFHAGPQYYGITELARVRDEPALDWYRRYLL